MAYQVKGLFDKLKVEAKDALEKAAVATLKTIGDWAVEESKKKEHGLVDTLVQISVPQILPPLYEYADKINGKVDIVE